MVADVELHPQPLGEPPEHEHGRHVLPGLDPSHGGLLEAEPRPELRLGEVVGRLI